MINGQIGYYTTQQAAEILGMSGSNVLLLLHAGKLKDVSPNDAPRARKRVDASSVHTLAEQRRLRRELEQARKAASEARRAERERKRRLEHLMTTPSIFERQAPTEQPSLADLMQQQITQNQQVIALLTKIVDVWSGESRQ